MSTKMELTHAIVWTDKKGGDFVGECVQCGQKGLKMSDALKKCNGKKVDIVDFITKLHC